MPSRLRLSVEHAALALERAIKLIEPLDVTTDASTVVWPSGDEIAAQIAQDLAENTDTALWDRLMPDVAGVLDAE